MATAHAERAAPWRAARPRSEPGAAAEGGGFKAKLTATTRRLEAYAVFRILESTAEGFRKDRVPNHAAAMTYYGIFSLFPLILLFMSLAGLALQSNETAREQIMNVVMGLLPQGQDQLRQVIAGVIEAKGAAAGIGLLTLLWGALGWFQVIDDNINQIWGIDKPRSFIKGKLFALAMVAAIGGVALASWAATAAINLLASFTTVIPGSVLLWQAVVSLVSVLTMAAGFFVLYRYSPQRRVAFADVWPAALTTALIWEATRRILAFYLEKNNMISGYGPIGAAMALLFWIYVASMIVLIGTELTYAIAKERRHIPPQREMPVVAPPGEQPTPKFAPQVGGGFSSGEDQKEPTRAEAVGPAEQGAAHSDGHGPAETASAAPAGPEVNGSGPQAGVLKNLLWTGLSAGSLALAGLAARRISSAVWGMVMREPPPTGKV
jgi:membrane protein